MHPFFQSLLPQHTLSRIAGWIARCECVWLKNRLIRNFIRDYRVDMSLAVKENPTEYKHFNDFFTRALKPEKRPIASAETVIVAPVDGRVSQFGDIQQGRLLQAKGIHYSLCNLLGGSKTLAACFQHGKFATFYLSPSDYHRVHSPCAAQLNEMIHVPGRLFSVNEKTTLQCPGLFSNNERVINVLMTAFGPIAVILVGAMLVASISTVWAGTIISKTFPSVVQRYAYPDAAVMLEKGGELGRFQLGSTVILLFADQSITWAETFSTNKRVQFGEVIASKLA